MYHEEKYVNGVLMYRTTPHGEWYRMSVAQLTARVRKQSDMISELRQELRVEELRVEEIHKNKHTDHEEEYVNGVLMYRTPRSNT